jgi:L-ribulose-5-phosphate 4-epimerase
MRLRTPQGKARGRANISMSKYDQIKEECYQANLLLPEFKLIDLTFGNVSVADRDQGVFAIKPSGVDYKHLSPDSIVVIDLEKGEVVEGTLRPSSDAPTHRRLLQGFEVARSIVHTHSRNAVAFAQAGLTIPCLGTTHADYFYGEVPVTRPMAPAEVESDYEWETGNVILECFKKLDPAQVPGVLVNGHGPFVWGANGAQAVEIAFALEIIAEMALKTMQLDRHVAPIEGHLLNKHFFRKHGPNAYYGQHKG